MSIAIRTKYLPVTTHKGSRITARPMLKNPGVLHVKSVTFGYYELDGDAFAKHCQVAKALAERLKWAGTYFAADDGEGGYVFVRASISNAQDAAFTILN